MAAAPPQFDINLPSPKDLLLGPDRKMVHDGLNNLGASKLVPGPIKQAANAMEWLGDSRNWVRVGEALVGLILIGVGVNAMLKNTAVGQSAKQVGSLATGPYKAKQLASSAAKKTATSTANAANRAHAVESAKLRARNGMT